MQEPTNSKVFLFFCSTLQIQSMVSLLHDDFGTLIANQARDVVCIFPHANWCFWGSQNSRGLLLMPNLADNTLNNVDWGFAPLDQEVEPPASLQFTPSSSHHELVGWQRVVKFGRHDRTSSHTLDACFHCLFLVNVDINLLIAIYNTYITKLDWNHIS